MAQRRFVARLGALIDGNRFECEFEWLHATRDGRNATISTGVQAFSRAKTTSRVFKAEAFACICFSTRQRTSIQRLLLDLSQVVTGLHSVLRTLHGVESHVHTVRLAVSDLTAVWKQKGGCVCKFTLTVRVHELALAVRRCEHVALFLPHSAECLPRMLRVSRLAE